MIDEVLLTCPGCGEDVPMTSILSSMGEGHMVHAPWECLNCGEGDCFHMSRTDWDAVMDVLGVSFGREPKGFLTKDERSMVRFRNHLESIEGPSDLEELWTSM